MQISHASTWNPTLLVNTQAFQVIDDSDTASDVSIKFGDTIAKSLTYERVLGRFRFDDDLSVAGSISGTSLRLDALNTSGALLYSKGTTGPIGQTLRGGSGQILVSRGTEAPSWSTPTASLVWYIDGDLSVGVSQGAVVKMPAAFVPTSVTLRVKGAPTGAAIIVNIKEAGTTLFSSKPQINAAATSDSGGAAFSDSFLAVESEITIDIDQVGSTFAGSGLTIMLNGTRRY